MTVAERPRTRKARRAAEPPHAAHRSSLVPTRAALSGGARARLLVATLLGHTAAATSRLTGRGRGETVRGAVLLRVDPTALPKLLAGRRIAVVSGTNGKTTTTHFLAAAVRAGLATGGRRLVHNADGANMYSGIASVLAEDPDAELAVLETDERVVADLIRLGRPEVLVLLNFSRDQLDRHHEIKSLARSWRTALEVAGPAGPVVVANANEPLVVWAAQAATEMVWVNTAASWNQDAAQCPNCGGGLLREPQPDGAGFGEAWACGDCDLAQPKASWVVTPDGQIADPEGRRWNPRLRVPGMFNVSNAACALAAADQLGVDTSTALDAMRTVRAPAGRFATIRFGDSQARLLLAKNPAGWAEALPLARTPTVVLAIDSAAADGRDVSWLWDVEFEQLAGRTVIATGPRAQDLAVRLSYAGVDHRCVPDLAAALAGHPEPVDVVATYTPFQRLRRMGGV